MLLHSYTYYELNETIVDDDKWQEWANELRDLQNSYAKFPNTGFYDRMFRGWDGSTGVHLVQHTPLHLKTLATQLLKEKDNGEKCSRRNKDTPNETQAHFNWG